MGKRPRLSTTERDAQTYDAVVMPRYGQLMARGIIEAIPEGMRAKVLDIACRTGCPALDILKRLDVASQVIAIDRDAALLDIARRRALDDAGRRVFFKVEAVESLGFGDEVFDVVAGNLAIASIEDPDTALGEVFRVLKKGGQLVIARPLAGSFTEVVDMFRELALRDDNDELRERLTALEERYPTAGAFAAWVRAAGFAEPTVEQTQLRLPFRSAGELFGDPLIQHIALAEWRWVAGLDARGSELLKSVESHLDVYFGKGPLSLTVELGTLTTHRPGD